jgi:hypothetical protein
MPPDFTESLKQVESLVTHVPTQDRYIFPDRNMLHPLWPYLPRATYMNLWDSDGFTWVCSCCRAVQASH